MPKGIWKPFTKKELDFIRANYLDLPYKTIGRMLGVGGNRIKKTIERLGLEVPKDLIEQRRKDSCFKKGQPAFNKGKKLEDYMDEKAIKKVKRTQFKRGHSPHNTKYDGCISIRKDTGTGIYYKYIRLAKGKWELLHRVVWEKETGEKLKSEDIIAFKDGNQKNCEFSNLKKINREENMIRNSWIEIPEELVPTMVLNARLNKILESKTNQDEK